MNPAKWGNEFPAFYIAKAPAALSTAQVQSFPFKMNARPVQPLNGRKVSAS